MRNWNYAYMLHVVSLLFYSSFKIFSKELFHKNRLIYVTITIITVILLFDVDDDRTIRLFCLVNNLKLCLIAAQLLLVMSHFILYRSDSGSVTDIIL